MPLGRWRNETCPKKMNQKIDLSNEDHCGPCGQYALGKIESEKKTWEKDLGKIKLEKNNLIAYKKSL